MAAVPRDVPPWYVLDKQGKPSGFAVEIFQEIADRSGVEVRYEIYPDWAEAIAAVQAERADLIPTLGMAAERQEDFAFSSPVEIFSLSILVREVSADLGLSEPWGMKVGVVEANAAVSILGQREDVELSIHSDVEDAVFDLLAGRVDAVVYPEPVLRSILWKLALTDRLVFLDQPLQEIRRGIAVKRSRAELLDRFQPAIEEFIGSEPYREIYQRWFGEPPPLWSPRRVAALSAVLLLLVVLGMGVWRYRSVLRVNRQLELAEARYHALVRHAMDAIVVADEEGQILDVNDAATHLFESTREELLNSSLDDCLTTIGGDGSSDLASVRSGSRLIREQRIERSGGGVVEVEVSAGKLPDGRLLAILRDLSERNRTALELERQARYLRLLNSVTLLVNDAASQEEAVELTLESVCRGIDWPVGHAYLAAEDGAGMVSGSWHNETGLEDTAFRRAAEEAELKLGQGMPSRVLASAQPEWIEDLTQDETFRTLPSMNGTVLQSGFAVLVLVGPEPVAVLEFFHSERRSRDPQLLDIVTQIGTLLGRAVERERSEIERAEAERRLRQSHKMEAVGRLAGGIAHDFNNLLMVILGLSEELCTEVGDSRVRASLEEIRGSARRAATLTHQLLAFSRQQIVEPRLVDLTELLGGLESMLRRLLGEDVRVEIRNAEDLGLVKADPGQLEQVIVNLAINAREAMPRGGTLTLTTTNVELEEGDRRVGETGEPGSYVLLRVGDTGTGIREEIRDLIFEPFYTSKGKTQGTGLGLATCFGIVTQAGGSISFESAEGSGTVFSVLLPRVSAEEATEAPAVFREDEDVDLGSDHERVLVVEDEPGVLRMIRRILESLGYEVTEADSAEAALELFEDPEFQPDLLLTDVVLTGASGRELVDEVQRIRPGLPVLFMTGYTRDTVLQEGLEHGEIELLHKPFSRAELARRLRERLG